MISAGTYEFQDISLEESVSCDLASQYYSLMFVVHISFFFRHPSPANSIVGDFNIKARHHPGILPLPVYTNSRRILSEIMDLYHTDSHEVFAAAGRRWPRLRACLSFAKIHCMMHYVNRIIDQSSLYMRQHWQCIH